MKRPLSIFALLVIYVHGTAQPSDRMTGFFKNIRTGVPADASDILKTEKPEVVLRNVMPYFNDSLYRVRSAAYRLTFLAGTTSHVAAIRQQAAEYLVLSFSMHHGSDIDKAVAYLKQFNKSDFNEVATDSLRSWIERNALQQTDLIRLAGFLEIHELENRFQNLSLPGNSQRVRWAALLALSRMEDATAMENVLTRVGRLKIGDDVVYDIFPDLVFTRQKPAIQFMVDVMNSDNKDCFSSDAENEVPILCGYRIMEQLAPVVQGYPIPSDVAGDVKSKKYAEALHTVRNWFKKHPDFVVIRNTY